METEADRGKIIRQIINEKLKQISKFTEDVYMHTQSLDLTLEDRSQLLFYLENIKDYSRRVTNKLTENHKIGDE